MPMYKQTQFDHWLFTVYTDSSRNKHQLGENNSNHQQWNGILLEGKLSIRLMTGQYLLVRLMYVNNTTISG